MTDEEKTEQVRQITIKVQDYATANGYSFKVEVPHNPYIAFIVQIYAKPDYTEVFHRQTIPAGIPVGGTMDFHKQIEHIVKNIAQNIKYHIAEFKETKS